MMFQARKFTAYLIRKLGVDATWKLLCSSIVNRGLVTLYVDFVRDDSPTFAFVYFRRECEIVGHAINDAYRQAIDVDCEMATKSAISERLYKPLIESTILTKRVYAEKFGAVCCFFAQIIIN